jgi:hypothetical protein
MSAKDRHTKPPAKVPTQVPPKPKGPPLKDLREGQIPKKGTKLS